MRKDLQGKLLQNAVCLAIAGMSVGYGAPDVFAATNYVDGNIYYPSGKTEVIGVQDGTTYSKTGAVVTLAGSDIVLGDKALQYGGGIVVARVEQAAEEPPVINVNATNSLKVTSDYTAVAPQDGYINIGSKDARVNNIELTSTGTYAAVLGDKQPLAEALSNNAYSTIYARNLFGNGEANIWGNDIKIETAENTMTNIPSIKYGTAISGNGNGAVNIHSTGTTTIRGAIESLNTKMQSKGTTGISININQDATDTGKVDMEGLFINAADKSQVNINGSDGSSIRTDLVASASSATSGAGGKININLTGDNSEFAGGALATNAGQIKLTAANIDADYLKVFGEGSKAEFTGNDISFARAATPGGAALSALVNTAATNAPVATVMGKNVSATSVYTAVSAQDGIVNIGSASNAADNVTLSTTGTYAAALGDEQPLAEALSDNAYATIFSRNLFGNGEVNIYATNVNVETVENTMTNIPTIKYGTAISGNGSGEVNIHSTGTTTIHGAIESLNSSLQSNGTTGIKVNVNQDAADTGKVDMEGLFINAADKSQVNINGSDGSSIVTDLVASASSATSGAGGKININLTGDNSEFAGGALATNAGQIKLTAANIDADYLKVFGEGSKAEFTGNDISFARAATPGGAALSALVNKAATNAPVATVMGKNVSATSVYTAVSAQDGIVNIGSASKAADNVTLSTTGTYDATGTDAAATLSDNAYATIFSRNLFGNGEVNIYATNVNVETVAKTMTNMDFAYGTAISGNGSGEVNIHSTGTTTIHGAIESLNTYLQSKGTTGIKVNINQDAADTGKVDMEGLFINAADQSEVNINGSTGSSIKTNLLASATSATEGAGGKINLALTGEGSTFAGNVTATNGGNITLNVTNANANIVTADGATSAVNVTGGNLTANTYATTNEGKINVTGGALSASASQLFSNAVTENTTGDKLIEGLTFANGASLVVTDDAAFAKDYIDAMGETYKDATITLSKGTVTGLTTNDKGEVDITELNGVGANLANVAVTTDGKNLVIGAPTTSADEVSVGNLGVNSIDLGASNSATIKDGGALTLTGNGTGTLISTTGTDKVEVDVEGATLNLGTPGVSGGGTIDGSVSVTAGSTVNVAEGNFAVTTLNTDGSKVEVGTNGVLNTEELSANNGSVLTVNEGAKVNTENLSTKDSEVAVVGALNVDGVADLAEGTVLNIGNSENKGTFTAKEVTLKEGASMFLDPSWTGGTANPESASAAGIGTFGTTGLAGSIAVGQNSLMSIGDADTAWAIDGFNKNAAGWTWGSGAGQVGAALAIKGNQTLAATGAIVVDGTLTAAPAYTANSATFAQDSLYIVDGTSVSGGIALQGDGSATLNVANGAKLLVVNNPAGSSFFPVYGFTNQITESEKWELGTTDRMLTASYDDSTPDKGDVKLTVAASPTLDGTNASGIINSIYANGLNDVNSSNAGIAFLSKAANSAYIANDKDAANTINSATAIAAVGGQQGSTLNATKMFTGSIQNHITNDPADRHIWAEFNHGKTKTRDLDLGNSNVGYDNKANGVTVGADLLATDTRHAGVAITYGTGKVTSSQDAEYTKNEYDYYGIDLYHAWHTDKAVVLADLGYIKNSGEIKQNNRLADLNADVDSNAWTLGARAEFKTDNDFTPYVGLRYVRLTTDSFDTKGNDGTVFNTGKDTQNLFLLPLGMKWQKNRAEGFSPKADLGVMFAFGDKNTNSTVSVPGVAASDTVGVKVTDSVSFLGSCGFDYKTKNATYGLAYQLQYSSHEVRNGFMATAQFSF